MGARRNDQESYRGEPTTTTQSRAFPRNYVPQPGGTYWPNDEIPQDIIDAQCEQALALADGEGTGSTGLEGFNEIVLGPLELKMVQPQPDSISPDVERLLQPFISSGLYNVGLSR